MVEVQANKTDDVSIKLPIVAIRRPDGFTIKNPNKKPLTFDGMSLDTSLKVEYDGIKSRYKNNEITKIEYQTWLSENRVTALESDIASLNAVPIVIRYYIDVYTRYQHENDLYMRNLIFNFINYPTFQVNFSYNNIPIEHNGNIILEDKVSTEAPNIKLFSDQICKQTLTIIIDDAYLWDTRIHSSVSLNNEGSAVEIYDVDRNDFIIEHF